MTRIATCDLKGLPATARNKRRSKLLSSIAGRLQDLDPPADAVVLPGGYFQEVRQGEPRPYLKLDFEGRCDLLREAHFAEAATEAARALDKRRKDTLLIFGVDTKDPRGDQLCVAWSAEGPKGVGRKVFPTEEEGNNGYIVSAYDFGTEKRIVRLGDTRVLLCSCYDGYGIYNHPDKSKYIKQIWAGDAMLRRGEEKFSRCLERCLKKWRRLAGTADAAAVAIHHFGSTNYWRCHGIATASAVLTRGLSATAEGGWVAAGANFHGRLPKSEKDILASHAVEEEFLSIKPKHRPTRDATPVCDWVEGDDEVRIRLFDFHRPRGRKTRNHRQ